MVYSQVKGCQALKRKHESIQLQLAVYRSAEEGTGARGSSHGTICSKGRVRRCRFCNDPWRPLLSWLPGLPWLPWLPGFLSRPISWRAIEEKLPNDTSVSFGEVNFENEVMTSETSLIASLHSLCFVLGTLISLEVPPRSPGNPFKGR
jgi:hypothetical protein